MSFVQEKSSNGFTKTGQLLLQEAVKSYIYSVLGSQARTRFKIVGAGAKSLQTQQIFHTIAKDTIAQDDDSVLIANMQKAISSTNVVLDMTIIPEVVLIPSSMVILNKPMPGYNNVLTTATKSMAFGKNNKVNYQGLVKKKKLPKKEPEEEKFSHTLTTTREESADESDEDKTPTNVSPPLILPKKKNDLPTLTEKRKPLGRPYKYLCHGTCKCLAYLLLPCKVVINGGTRKHKYRKIPHKDSHKEEQVPCKEPYMIMQEDTRVMKKLTYQLKKLNDSLERFEGMATSGGLFSLLGASFFFNTLFVEKKGKV